MALVLAVLASLATAAPAAAQCANADQRVTEANLSQAVAATFCLHNQQRAAHGLPPLRWSSLLARAAEGHSRDMVANVFFSHDSPDGRSPGDRIDSVGYLPSDAAWAYGENIAWGSGPYSTPASIMRGWMESPGHRANILDRRFRDLGLGLVTGAPRLDLLGAATYTADFGYRDVPGGGSGGAPPATAALPSPGLRITRVGLRGRRLRIRGRVASAARGGLVVSYRTRAGGRRYGARKRVRAHEGRFSVRFRLPRGARRATVRVRYAGDATYRAQAARRAVRRR